MREVSYVTKNFKVARRNKNALKHAEVIRQRACVDQNNLWMVFKYISWYKTVKVTSALY